MTNCKNCGKELSWYKGYKQWFHTESEIRACYPYDNLKDYEQLEAEPL